MKRGTRCSYLRFVPKAVQDKPAAAEADKGRGGRRTIYRLSGKKLAPVSVQLGISDGKFTEVLDSPLGAGDAVVVEEGTSAAKRDEARRALPGKL